MVQIQLNEKRVTAKVVFYGPGMSGKTTNLQVIHARAPEGSKGDLTSLSTDGDRTLFFDFMPLDLGTVAGLSTRFQLYTVPGQVYYNSTRKLVLQGVDGVVFVADSGEDMMPANLESLANLQSNLAEYGRDWADIPLVLQFNKRDLEGALPVDQMRAQLRSALGGREVCDLEAIATTGEGVFPTLKAMAAEVLERVHREAGGLPASSHSSPRSLIGGEPTDGTKPRSTAATSCTEKRSRSTATPVQTAFEGEATTGVAALPPLPVVGLPSQGDHVSEPVANSTPLGTISGHGLDGGGRTFSEDEARGYVDSLHLPDPAPGAPMEKSAQSIPSQHLPGSAQTAGPAKSLTLGRSLRDAVEQPNPLPAQVVSQAEQPLPNCPPASTTPEALPSEQAPLGSELPTLERRPVVDHPDRVETPHRSGPAGRVSRSPQPSLEQPTPPLPGLAQISPTPTMAYATVGYMALAFLAGVALGSFLANPF